MYEMPIEWLKMDKVFGSANGRILRRNGLFSIEDVRDYVKKYPFDEYSKYHGTHYRHIGPARYIQIVEAIEKEEKES